ncbi:hypothetical protein JXI42_07050 [bacterium]|nr:hypothetical protein [bacterium]
MFSILFTVSVLSAEYHPHEKSPFGFHPAKVVAPSYPDIGYIDAEYIGIRWTREGIYAFWFLVQPELSDTTLDFTFYDNQYSIIPDSICILGNIAPQGGRDEGRCLGSSWLPVDSALYVRFVRMTIERYDGDGISDMPGLTNPIKYWQVGNEPDGSPRIHFPRLQRMTYDAIKEADPEAQVLIGGCTGFPHAYIHQYDIRFAPFMEELAGCCFDIFDMHWYGEANGEYNLVDTESRVNVLQYIHDNLVANGYPPDIPIWITEMGTYSGDPVPMGPHYNPPFQSERQHAGDLFKRNVFPFSRGVKKVFMAFGLIEGFNHDTGYFDFTGLIYDGWGPYDMSLGAKKLGYYTYKKMTEMLEGCEWEAGEDLSIIDSNIFIFRVERDSSPVLISWWDYYRDPHYSPGDTITFSVYDIACDSARITNVVPHYDLGIEVVEYSEAFDVDNVEISGDSLVLNLGVNPIIVEPMGDVGIKDQRSYFHPNEYEILAYPNPFNSTCHISTPFGSWIKIYNITGRVVFSLECTILECTKRLGASITSENNCSNAVTGLHANGEFLWRPNPTLNSGIYFIKATSGEQTVTKRIVYLK